MQNLITRSKSIAFIAVISMLIASASTFIWGAYKTYLAIALMITSHGKAPQITYYLIQLVDVFLVAIVIYLVAASVYEMFIGDLPLPEWMLAHNIHELKAKLSSLIILVMAVKFLEQLLEWQNPQEVLYYAIAVSLISGVLIAFSQFGGKD
jgi:uncharacterized membrane protein YqhA